MPAASTCACNRHALPRRQRPARLGALLLPLLCAVAGADDFPKPGWHDSVSPLVSPRAVPGGEISISASAYPESFNYYLANNSFTADLFSGLYETLLDSDPLTFDFAPGLAERWSISEDRKTFTFWIDPAARWSDGRPVTAEDVAWTFAAIMNPTNMTGEFKVGLEQFLPPEILATNAIRFTCKEVHWRNLLSVGGIMVLPKHVYAGRDFNKTNFELPVMSGPYRIEELKEGVYVRMRRRTDWWRRGRQSSRHSLNFDRITYRFYAESANAFEAFKKGLVDVYPVNTARIWVLETNGDRFEKSWVVKQWIQNYQPVGFQGFAMNMRRAPFDDPRVRMAMAHLLNRERMNSTLMYNQYFLHRSYYEDLYSPALPCTNPDYNFDKAKARALLDEAGWRVNPATGLLEKNGAPFTFRFLFTEASHEKFLAIYAEDLKDVGIRLVPDSKDWSAWAKDMDACNFDMTWAAWGAGIYKDPEGMWASKEAGRPGGSNITGFQDPRVDELVEKQRTIFDLQQRNAICREIDGLVTRQCPYVLLWNLNAVRLLYWNRFGTPPAVLSRYGNDSAATSLWWYDEDAADNLRSAMEHGWPLPQHNPVVLFDQAFRPAASDVLDKENDY